jgi:Ca2+-binding EF-hand superfamily protein
LAKALCNGNWTPFNPNTVQMLIGLFDKDNSFTIDFEEFCSLWKFLVNWENCFRLFDKDGSGSIDKSELKEALSTFGMQNLDDMIVF